MACKTRKGPRRPPAKPRIDDEMIELASVLAEHTLDNNAEGWFKLPWRDGWNAVALGLHVVRHHSSLLHTIHNVTVETLTWLEGAVAKRDTSQDVYWTAQDMLSTTVTPDPMLRGALRCLQVLISNSDGGGHVYNAILSSRFASLCFIDVEDLVLEYRCRDAIGVTAVLANDVNDRLRRAFTIAWKRGLYMAAYSLPQAKE